MATYSIRKYRKDDFSLWNQLVKNSKNGTFLFQRSFMEYHADRFQCCSLIIYKDSIPVALFPANVVGDKVYSHQGLTYGGLILGTSIGGEKVNNIVKELIAFYKQDGIKTIFIKSIPVFYHKRPTNELTFLFSDIGAKLYRRDLNLAIDYRLPLQIHKNKLKNYTKRKKIGFVVEEVEDMSDFWNTVLIPRLREKHAVSPVHTLEEILLLKKQFPENIKQFVVLLKGELLAGITLFIDNQVVKSQYGAVTSIGEKHRALDFLFISLINRYKDLGYLFFDMGTVTEHNFGLLKQKEELGCEIYTQDFYSLDIG